MNTQDNSMKMTNYRWMICMMLFIATTVRCKLRNNSRFLFYTVFYQYAFRRKVC